jgi:ankyrin repeat protein
MLAAKRGDRAKCGELILMGADVNARDKERNTALILALWGGYEESERLHKPRSAIVLETVQLLLDKDADVNAANTNGYTPIMCAPDPRFAKGHLPIVRALVRRGAKVNARTHDGWTPLMAAAHSGDVAMVRFLLSQGADVKARMELLGYTARDFAAFQGHSEVVASLDNAGPQ